jgi:hypothetical protein
MQLMMIHIEKLTANQASLQDQIKNLQENVRLDTL